MGAVWVPAKVVQELFGHSTISMTIDIYARMHPSVQREVMDKMDSFFRQQLELTVV